jgi:transcriptional regulator with XRE-family HTH domain
MMALYASDRTDASVTISLFTANRGLPSHPMMRLHEILNSRRVDLGWTYEDVHGKLEAYPWPDGVQSPSLATVGHWFNGTRRPRHMQHLKAICAVLDVSLDEAIRGEPREAKTAEEQVLLDQFRDMSAEDREVYLAMGRRLGVGGKS